MKEIIERIKKMPYLQNMKIKEIGKDYVTFINKNGQEVIGFEKPYYENNEIIFDYMYFEEVKIEIPKFILKVSQNSINFECKTNIYKKQIYIKTEMDLIQYILKLQNGIADLAKSFDFCKYLTEEENNNSYLIIKKVIEYSGIPLNTIIDVRVDEELEIKNKRIINYKEQGVFYFLQYYYGIFCYAEKDFRVRLDEEENIEFSICGKKETFLKNEDVSQCLKSAFEKISLIRKKMCDIENSLWKKL